MKNKNTVKSVKNAFVCLLAALAILFSCGCSQEATPREVTYTELGIPSQLQYNTGIAARCPWDMILWDEKLYVGSGDFDRNEGPVAMWCYDLGEKEWDLSGFVPDEEVNRFYIINNTLTAPGIDPTGEWILGNYYTLSGDQWVNHRTIDGGIHNFDMTQYDGMLFCGLGVRAGKYPVMCSQDGGNTFTAVEMVKNGTPLDTSEGKTIRTYDLFVLADTLYATFSFVGNERLYELYRYEDGKLVFYDSWLEKIDRIPYRYTPIGGKAEFNGYMFFTTGYLYATADMQTLSQIPFPEDQVVYDLCLYGDCLYALCGRPLADGTWEISIWKNDGTDPSDFSQVLYFTYQIPPLSFCCYDGHFYIGAGNIKTEHDKNGTILDLKYKGIK